MSYHLNLKIDDELAAALEARAAQHGLTMSQTVREILRRGVGIARKPEDNAVREAVIEVKREILARLAQVFADVEAEVVEGVADPKRKRRG